VWDKRAPADCDFGRFIKDEAAIRGALRDNGAQAVAVPYRQNRCVTFNSDLYHETAPLDFREGYENRRINVTMLYGRRAGSSLDSKESASSAAHCEAGGWGEVRGVDSPTRQLAVRNTVLPGGCGAQTSPNLPVRGRGNANEVGPTAERLVRHQLTEFL
jgi:hypothetical protein